MENMEVKNENLTTEETAKNEEVTKVPAEVTVPLKPKKVGMFTKMGRGIKNFLGPHPVKKVAGIVLKGAVGGLAVKGAVDVCGDLYAKFSRNESTSDPIETNFDDE